MPSHMNGNKSMTGGRLHSLMLASAENVKVRTKYKIVPYKCCTIRVWEKLTPEGPEWCDAVGIKGMVLCTRQNKKLAEIYIDQYILGLRRIPFVMEEKS